MSDQNAAVVFEPGKVPVPAGNSGGSPEPGQSQVSPPAGQGESNTPKFITLDEAQRLANEAALQAEERAFKRARDLVRTTDKKITGKVQADLATLENMIKLQKSAGIEVTPMQEAQLRNQVISQAYSQADSTPDEPAQADKPTPPATSEGAADPITAEAWRLMQAAGIIINDGDPEAEKLDQSSGYAFLRSIETAIETKRQRIASTSMQAPGRTPTGAGATGAHQANPIQDITDPAELLKIAKAQGLF